MFPPNLFRRTSLLWPLLVAALLMVFYGWYQGGRLFADAFEYDEIARSLLNGSFSYLGVVTMFREPLYPLFRAAIYAVVGIRPMAVLVVQLCLQLVSIGLVARAVHRLNPAWELPTAWLSALYPGFAIIASQHYSESFTAFLLACTGWVWMHVWTEKESRRIWRWVVAFGILVGLLALTRAVYQYLGIFAGIVMICFWSVPLKRRLTVAATIFLLSAAVMAPWIFRNEQVFHRPAITNRLGFLAYTLVGKAQVSWAQIGTTYSSVLIGRSLTHQFIPTVEPNIVETWKETWQRKETLVSSGLDVNQADVTMFGEARQMFLASPITIVKYLVWRPIDILRFFAFTSPLTPKFSIERMFVADETLSWTHGALLCIAHGMQLLWWAVLFGGLGWLAFHRRFDHASLLLVGYTIGIHSLLDNIPRYAAPLVPWLMAIIAIVVVSLWTRYGRRWRSAR